MKADTRKRLSELILEELGEKIKKDQYLRQKLEPFTDLPVEKVADAILRQFDYLLSSDLRDLIIHLIEREIEAEDAETAAARIETTAPVETAGSLAEPHTETAETTVETVPGKSVPPHSIMEHFGVKEHFPMEPIDFELHPEDWYYLYGFCYAPDSTGKGVPVKKLSLKGADGLNDIFLLDYGDVRFFMNRITPGDYQSDKTGKPTITAQKSTWYKYAHEHILNALRSEELMVSFPFWSVIQGRDALIKQIEDRYVELLRVLVDVHDATDWDAEIFAYDKHIIGLPFFAEGAKDREVQRTSRHQVAKTRNIKEMEKLLFKEKSLAQEMHSHLLLHSVKAKIDFMIRLDNAFMDDWKSILDARYTVGKEKRKNFLHAIVSLQKEYEEFKLMFRVTNPNIRFSFIG